MFKYERPPSSSKSSFTQLEMPEGQDDQQLPMSTSSLRSRKRRSGRSWLATLTGIAAVLLIVFLNHYPLTLPPSSEDQTSQTVFSPDKCQQPPTECWDTLQKRGGMQCTPLKHDTMIRGSLVPAGSRTCYKSIYFNLDRQSFLIFSWLLVWIMISARSVERMLRCALKRRLNWFAAFAVLINMQSVWYGCSVIIHYLNDYYFDFYRSQLYFTVTEMFTFSVCTWLLDSRVRSSSLLLYVCMGTACYHAVQLLMDEGVNLLGMGTLSQLLRDGYLLLTDLSIVRAVYGAGHLQIKRDPLRYRLIKISLVMLMNMLAFHFIFADDASYQSI